GHPFDLGWALTFGAQVLDFLGEPDEWLRRIEEVDRLGRENSLQILTEILVPGCSGVALIRMGQTAKGMALTQRSAAIRGASGRAVTPYWKSFLAEGMAQLGNLAAALALVDEAIAQVERPGWEERWYYAETLRIKGWILALKGELEAAERTY